MSAEVDDDDAAAPPPPSTALSAEPPAKEVSIKSVSHINSYDPAAQPRLPGWEPPSDVTASPAELLAKLGDGVQEHKDVAGFARNPKLVKEDVGALKSRLEVLRSGLDDAGRLGQAEALKAEANKQFAAARWQAALVGYVAGLWFLRRGAAAGCPMVVATGLATP